MIRLSEAALFLAPFLVFAAWWMGARARWLAWGVFGGVVVLVATLTVLALTTGFPRSGGYVPAHLQDGRVVDGHGS